MLGSVLLLAGSLTASSHFGFLFAGPAAVTNQSPVPCKLCILTKVVALCTQGSLPAPLLELLWGGRPSVTSNVGVGQVLGEWGFPFITQCSQCGLSFNVQIPPRGSSSNQTSSSVQAKVGLGAIAYFSPARVTSV